MRGCISIFGRREARGGPPHPDCIYRCNPASPRKRGEADTASPKDQWLIIHGLAVGKLFAPLLVFLTSRDGLVEQQEQPGACEALYSASVFGACALRSLTAWALRVSAGMQAKCGAVRMTRGDDIVQLGQSCGRSHSAIGRMSVKGPQASQRYS